MSETSRDDQSTTLPAIRLASDDRERAVARLSDAFAQDVLPVEEFERRLDAVYAATDRTQLDLLTRDLPSGATTSVPGVASTARSRDLTDTRRLSSVFSNVERAGFTEMPHRLEIRGIVGNVELDCSRSRFAPGVTEIIINATLSNVELLLPSFLRIENDGAAFLGSFSVAVAPPGDGTSSAAAPTAPSVTPPAISIVRISGRALLSNVEITQLPAPLSE